MSVSTNGIKTARVWLEQGYNFDEYLPDGMSNVLLACQYDFLEMLEFLKNEAGVDLVNYTQDGKISSLEYSFRGASFKCYCYLIEEYFERGCFEENPDLLEKILDQLLQASNLLEILIDFSQWGIRV